ncbi:MAG: gamma-glutamyl-gamma-aminobutyrate hydrolase family protein [Pseudomonadota bacterium]
MSDPSITKPLVGVTSCFRFIERYWFHVVNDQYLTALVDGAQAMPVNIPVLADRTDIDGLLDRLDGLLITGSPSNVEPHHYGGPAFDPEINRDPQRDATVLPLIERALERGTPLLAICRGIQELNVVLGGTLFQKVAEVEGRQNHLAPSDAPVEKRFARAHEIEIKPGGYLAGLLGKEMETVNSIHAQGINALGRDLAIEAVAPDGQIEAIRVTGIPGFALGVQWHPEYAVTSDPVSAAIFAGFGRVLRGEPFVPEGAEAAQ